MTGRLKRATVLLATAASVAALPNAAAADTVCVNDGLVAGSSNQAQVEAAMVCVVNAYRVRNGAPPARIDGRLAAAARAHSADMNANGYLGHVDSHGHDAPDRARAAGYPGGVGENVAAHGSLAGLDGRSTAYYMFGQWRQSRVHNSIMLEAANVATGFGEIPAYRSGALNLSGMTGTQMFGKVAANTSATGLEGQIGPAPANPFAAGSAGNASAASAKKKCKRKHKRSAAKRKRCKKKLKANRQL